MEQRVWQSNLVALVLNFLLFIKQVHIADLTELYLLVLSRALSGVQETSSYAKFYFGSVQEHVWGDIIRQIAQILYEAKRIPTPDVKSVKASEEPMLRWVLKLDAWQA